MNEYNQRDTTSVSGQDELLRVLIDKVVDNGTAIRETRAEIRRLPEPGAAMEGLDQRIGALEEKVGVIGTGMGERIGGLERQMEVVAKGVAGLGAQVGEPTGWLLSGMRNLQSSLEVYVDFFTKPMQKEVHHRHFLGRPMLLGFVVLFVIGLQWYGLIRSWNREDMYEKNDLLWRGAKLSGDSVVTRALDKVKRDYESDPGQFGKDVVTEEERRAELFERWRQVNEGMGKIRVL
ncbi:MAG TPA: hypothetical protein VKQ52_03205, partial [Puia sp.]|nr:hypothetical protein [Puia sp.]